MHALVWRLQDLGHGPMGWHPPNGYPVRRPRLAVALGLPFRRWHTKMDLVAGWWPTGFGGQDLHAMLPTPLPATYGELVDVIARRVLFRAPPPGVRAAALALFGVDAGTALRSWSDIVPPAGGCRTWSPCCWTAPPT